MTVYLDVEQFNGEVTVSEPTQRKVSHGTRSLTLSALPTQLRGGRRPLHLGPSLSWWWRCLLSMGLTSLPRLRKYVGWCDG